MRDWVISSTDLLTGEDYKIGFIYDTYKKNTNLYKTILNDLLKLNVSEEILPLLIVNFWEIWKKKKLFSLMCR